MRGFCLSPEARICHFLVIALQLEIHWVYVHLKTEKSGYMLDC
ncbi:protein of unknown function [Xenorhabdus doucetiae]|uniref:Uncharacterized protein n=1 Tax=Xenorhabdus doucetiae TaxID=351671 RepID=A0A068QRS4_9GAMM|nr:protein of unknown function [Xenorhabdus doucetiae]